MEGGLQEKFIVGEKRLHWSLQALPYSLVHVSTGNIVLVAAALVVGLVLGHEAHHYGIAASSTTHILWIILSIQLIPYT